MGCGIIKVLAVFVFLASAASATPFTVEVSINGVDPSAQTAVVEAGKAAQVAVDLSVNAPGVTITGVEVDSDPPGLGGLLEAFVEGRVDFPKELKSTANVGYYDIPGLVPAGEYDVTARIHYGGNRIGVMTYRGSVKVESEGILSMLLGLLIKVLPKMIVKPVAGVIL